MKSPKQPLGFFSPSCIKLGISQRVCKFNTTQVIQIVKISVSCENILFKVRKFGLDTYLDK